MRKPDGTEETRRISPTAAKRVLEEMFKTGDHPWYVIERLGLWLLPDDEVLRVAYLTVCDNPDLALKYRDGNEKVLNALVGKVMGQIKGRAVGTWVEDCVKASIGYIYQHCP